MDHGFIDTKFPSDACMHPPDVDWMEPITTSASASGENVGSNDEQDDPADLAATTGAYGRADEAGTRGGRGGEGGGAAAQGEGAAPELATKVGGKNIYDY